MFRKFFIALLFLATSLLAQDGVSPDTLYNHRSGMYSHTTEEVGLPNLWCADTSAHDSSAFYGMYDTTGGGAIKYINRDGGIFIDDYSFPARAITYYNSGSGYYVMSRFVTFFDTRDIPGLTSMKKIDSVFVRFELDKAVVPDGDSLFVLKFISREDSTPYAATFDYDELVNPCNFFQCSTEAWIDGATSHWGEYGVDLSNGWNNIKLEPGYIQQGDTTGIGFATKLTCDTAPGTWPTGYNYYAFKNCCVAATVDSTAFQLIYYTSPKYNDISHQDNADGISPDTIQFICSDEGDEVRSPGAWRNEWIPDWNQGDYSGLLDCFHGHYDSAYGCGDSSRCSNYWNYAMQPLVTATKRGGGYNDFQMIRSYFLFELEESIPDTTEIDSVKFYLKFGSVNVGDGDSLHAVTYTPLYSYDGSDTCIICYSCHYPALSAPNRWCNFWRCGDDLIWGESPDRSIGRVPQYLLTDWFWIHPSIIDFGTASVGDTFGIGLVLRFEDSPTPTDTNQVSILVDDGGGMCPKIIYWFSEHEEKGFINWGLTPPHLGWGLPLNQPRRAWGGSRRP